MLLFIHSLYVHISFITGKHIYSVKLSPLPPHNTNRWGGHFLGEISEVSLLHCLSSLPGRREEGTCFMKVGLNFLTFSQSWRETEDASHKNMSYIGGNVALKDYQLVSCIMQRWRIYFEFVFVCVFNLLWFAFTVIFPFLSFLPSAPPCIPQYPAPLLSRLVKFIFATQKASADERIETAHPKSLNKSPIYMAGR